MNLARPRLTRACSESPDQVQQPPLDQYEHRDGPPENQLEQALDLPAVVGGRLEGRLGEFKVLATIATAAGQQGNAQHDRGKRQLAQHQWSRTAPGPCPP